MRTTRFMPASRIRTAMAAPRTNSATLPRSARRCFPASGRRTKWTRRATASPATSTSKANCGTGCGSVRRAARNTTAISAARSTARLTARVQPNAYFLVRGSVSTGFRAPSLGQSFFSSTATNFLNLGQGLVPVESLTLPVELGARAGAGRRAAQAGTFAKYQRRHGRDADVRARSRRRLLPHRDRRPDRAVGQLHRRADRGACWRHSAPTARGSSPTRSTRGPTAWTSPAATGRRWTPPAMSTCAPATTTRGPASSGPWRRRRNSPPIRRSCSIASSSAGSSAVSRATACASAATGGGAVGFDLNRRTIRHVLQLRVGSNPADDQVYGAKWLTDVEGSLSRSAATEWPSALQNLFDVFPDRNSTVNSFNGIQTFPSHSPFGMNGRSLYARIGWTF